MAGDKKDNPPLDLEKGLKRLAGHEREIKEADDDLLLDDGNQKREFTEPRSSSRKNDRISLKESLLPKAVIKPGTDVQGSSSGGRGGLDPVEGSDSSSSDGSGSSSGGGDNNVEVEKQKEWRTNYLALAISFLGSVFTGRALFRPHDNAVFARIMLIAIFVGAGLILVLSWIGDSIKKGSKFSTLIKWLLPFLALALTIAGGVWIGMN
ncbi:hypothetical protein Sjap_019898 [Stephania japonica]|uniref:Uncharacterized protein n=1 Tax=Stephania japonica TaxID=461633 RepID=A0AAP0I070_9MAGN